jgi:hypothetical protein
MNVERRSTRDPRCLEDGQATRQCAAQITMSGEGGSLSPDEHRLPAEQGRERLGYPEAWLLIVATPALGYGIAVGRLYPNGAPLPTIVWAGASAAAGLALGALGGFVFARTAELAALGSAMWAACFALASELSSQSGRIPQHDQSGLGLVIVVVFVVTFVPMLGAAALARHLRRGADQGS